MHTSRTAQVVIGAAVAATVLAVAGATYYVTVVRPANKLRATAEVIQTQAQQILSAVNMYRNSRLGYPAQLKELPEGHFLPKLPVPPVPGFPDAGWEVVAATTPYYWLHNKVPSNLCKQVNLLVRGDDGIQAAAKPALKIQCFGLKEPYTLLLGRGLASGVLNMSAVIPAIDPQLSVDDTSSVWVSRPSVIPAANLRSPIITSAVDFGVINLGERSPRSVVFTNNTKQPIHVNGVYGLPESVQLQTGGKTLCPGTNFTLDGEKSCTLSLVFTANTDIPLEGEVTITSDYEGYRAVAFAITGRGIDPVGTVRTLNSGCVSPEAFGYDSGRRIMLTYGMYAGNLYGLNGWATVGMGCPNDGEFAPYIEVTAPLVHGPQAYTSAAPYSRLDCPTGYDPESLSTKHAAYDTSSDTIVYQATCHREGYPPEATTPGLVQIKRGGSEASLLMSSLTTESRQNWVPLSANDNSVVYYVAANADNSGLELRRLDSTGRNGYTVVFAQMHPSFMKDQGVVDPRGGNRYVWFPIQDGHQIARVDTQTGTSVTLALANMSYGSMYDMMTSSSSVAMDSQGLLYTNGVTKNLITVTDTTTGETTVLAGKPEKVDGTVDGDMTKARFQEINGLRLSKDEKYLMVADKNGYKYTMRKIRIRN